MAWVLATPASNVTLVPPVAGVVQVIVVAAAAGAAVTTASAVMPATVPIRSTSPKMSRPTPLLPSLRPAEGLVAGELRRGSGAADSSEKSSFEDIDSPISVRKPARAKSLVARHRTDSEAPDPTVDATLTSRNS